MEISQKVVEEEERYKSEMKKYQIVHIQWIKNIFVELFSFL